MESRTHYAKLVKETKRKRHAYEEKRAWVMARLDAKLEYSKRVHAGSPMRPRISATDEDDQTAWQASFGGKVVTYTLGPNVSPDFARTLRRMWLDGDLARGTAGNQDARNYGQKTYFVFYTYKTWPIIAHDAKNLWRNP